MQSPQVLQQTYAVPALFRSSLRFATIFFSLSVCGPRLLADFDAEPSVEAVSDDDVLVELLGDIGGLLFFLVVEGEDVDDTDLFDSLEYIVFALRGFLVGDVMSKK